MVTDSISFTLLRRPIHLLALGFGVGLVPKGPGTAGTLIAIIPGWLMMPLPLVVRIAVVAALFGFGVWICGESARQLGVHDHPAIVWDEIVGFLGVSIILPPNPGWWVAAVILFRIFDIAKPWPIRDLDRRLGGGMGIMLDDLVAGVFTVGCLIFARALMP
ncbi:MAG: phosphatidylglycerophosphatase A [Pseudomonadota bacterium]|jgi:phosphatidylglycerophosphatase A|nr:phosphatidylglycerophosphatase A [Pseudomonadota bacterium]